MASFPTIQDFSLRTKLLLILLALLPFGKSAPIERKGCKDKDPVFALCSTSARQLISSITEVVCPAGCLDAEGPVWGTDIYTDDSSICRAAIHAGRLTDAGGRVTMEKKLGKGGYQESTRNQISTRRYGPWFVSFIFSSASDFEPAANDPLTFKPPTVSALCAMAAKQLPTAITEVICPSGCLTASENVWGSDIYTDDSSICRAAIHAGRLTNEGGKVIVEKNPGQSSYEESTRNGIKTSKYGTWTGSFVFTSSSALPYATSPPLTSNLPIVTSQCSSAAKQLTQVVTE
ncbi:cysteine-rich secretory protein LCCL domain-containing 2-like [Ascaphus truei]|uniref:cysteine-rich secretory protein LCCL domain-containing 2-like n=1 Tax=Ascaphus truei TaxID=8439 RepID=UPI003F598DD4